MNRLPLPKSFFYGTDGKYYSCFKNVAFRLKSVTSLIRGRCIPLRSFHKNLEKNGMPLLVGAKVKTQFEPGSCIILKRSDYNNKNEDPYNPFYGSVVSIGFVPYWKYLNPPLSETTFLRLQKNCKLILGCNVLICRGSYLSVWPDKTLQIGDHSYVGHETYINTRCGLKIGNNVLIGHQVVIMDYDGHPVVYNDENYKGTLSYGGNSKPIEIGDDVWIGFRSTVLKGVRIGNGAIIGANSCVTWDVEPYTMVAGNPARVIAKNIKWKKY